MNRIVDKKGSSVYVNVNIFNPSTAPTAITATLNQSLTGIIVDNPSEYDLIISRISIPGNLIPLFYFQTQPYPNTDVNAGIYSVVLEYQGNKTPPQYLEFIPQTFKSPAIPAFSVYNPTQDLQDPYYYNYSYQNLCNMINGALSSALTAGAGFLPGECNCYMIYNNQSGYFSLLGTNNMFSSFTPSDPNNVRSWFNTPLARFFCGFKGINNGYNNPDGRDTCILIENDLNNSQSTQDGFNPNLPSGYLQVQLEFNSDFCMETAGRLLIRSSEFGGVVGQSEVTYGNVGTYDNIVADYIPAVSTQNGTYRSNFQYFASSEFYRRTLNGTNSLNKLALQYYWESVAGVIRPIYIAPGERINTLFILEKRKP